MALSPTVQAYQQHILQGQDNASAEQLTFNKKFGQYAFSTLNAKFPELQKHIVTFKVVESDIDKSFGLGAFIIENAGDVLYVPVVLHGGSITSCEILYNKGEETLEPLSSATIKSVLNTNSVAKPAVAPNKYPIENTRTVFKNLFRPPSSSNPVLASSSSFEVLPNAALDSLAAAIEQKPELLSKVASFYPIQALGEKLAKRSAVKDLAKTAQTSPEVLRIADLTKATLEKLSADEKQEIIQRGFIIRAPESDEKIVIGTNNLAVKMISVLDLIEKGRGVELYGKANLVHLDDRFNVVLKPCIIFGHIVITQDGVSDIQGRTLVLSNFVDGVTREDLVGMGAKTPEDLTLPRIEKDQNGYIPYEKRQEYDPTLRIFYPTKTSAYKMFTGGNRYGLRMISPFDCQKQSIDDEVYLKPSKPFYHGTEVGFNKRLSKGYVKIDDNYFMFPITSLLLAGKRDRGNYIQKMTSLYDLLCKTQTKLKVVEDGPELNLLDSSLAKTAKFTNEADLAEHLVKHYHLSKTAAEKVLKDRDALVFTKEAIGHRAVPEDASVVDQPSSSPYATQYQALPSEKLPGGQLSGGEYDVNGAMLDASASLGDEDKFDTGMLASLAGNDDIKLLLVDMLPQFSSTVTELGRAILTFTINQTEIEEYYGSEQYNTLLTNIRKMFRMLGEVIADLKKYVNMH